MTNPLSKDFATRLTELTAENQKLKTLRAALVTAAMKDEAAISKLTTALDEEMDCNVELTNTLDEIHDALQGFCSDCLLRDQPACTTGCPLYSTRLIAERR